MSHRGRGRSGSSDPHRGYSGGGGRGATQASSAPLLPSNRSFRRLGNGQGQQQQQQQQQARVEQSSQGVTPHNNADASRRDCATGSQRGLIPSPNNTFQTIHKAERKYEVGKVSDIDEAKQRQLRGILNKLTPQNFERLFQQVMKVNIDSIGTLMGLISQIFDRALLEPTFCAIYVNFCFHLAGALPDFIDEDDKFITFRWLLLNKCQEEFERGAREQAEAEKVEEEGEIKQSEHEREEKRLRSRRRKLGNIRFIGELFMKKMLAERIIYHCISTLLGNCRSPDEEDIEALCILMATIGEMIDYSTVKVHMDAFFDMMHKLSTNDKISSRVRFMLRDLIDLRKNKWQHRRKVECLKKIEDRHRDAAQERLVVVRRDGGNHSSMTRGGSKGGRPSFDCKVLEDMAQKSQLRVAGNRSGAKVSGGEGDSPWIQRGPAPCYHSYNDTNEGEEKQVDRNNRNMGDFTSTEWRRQWNPITRSETDTKFWVLIVFSSPIKILGRVACRDYPHSRHHCAKFPFNKTTHESCCPQCYCYVCDRVAPCKYWKGSLGHCHASDEDPKWKGMRMFHRGSLAEGQQFRS